MSQQPHGSESQNLAVILHWPTDEKISRCDMRQALRSLEQLDRELQPMLPWQDRLTIKSAIAEVLSSNPTPARIRDLATLLDDLALEIEEQATYAERNR